MRRRLPRITTAIVVATFSGVADDAFADIAIGGEFTVTTDYMFRGVSQTMSGVAFQGELGIEADNGWYGYAWASNVDFTDSTADDDGSRLELNFGVGHYHEFSDRLATTLEVTAYVFPGTKPGFDYDYAELNGRLSLDDQHHLTVGYSDNAFNSDSTGMFYALGTGIDLSEHISFGLELGHYDLENAYDISYRFAELSIAGD
ncbi:MAG: TorF family putative porin, partial [Woeseiaceae bacterium]